MINELKLFCYEWRLNFYYEELHAVTDYLKDNPTDYVAESDKKFIKSKCDKYKYKIDMIKAL